MEAWRGVWGLEDGVPAGREMRSLRLFGVADGSVIKGFGGRGGSWSSWERELGISVTFGCVVGVVSKSVWGSETVMDLFKISLMGSSTGISAESSAALFTGSSDSGLSASSVLLEEYLVALFPEPIDRSVPGLVLFPDSETRGCRGRRRIYSGFLTVFSN